MKEFFYAEKGKGAYLNGEKISCSQKEDWKGTYGLGTMRLRENYEKFQQGINQLSEETGWTNAVASSAVSGAWVSCGRRDWYLGPSKNAWDYVATSLIAQEAGCVVSNFAGTDYKPGDKGLVVANKFLFPQLIELVKKSYI
jgi:myo-inositol-1(or 4)-monophosphatase